MKKKNIAQVSLVSELTTVNIRDPYRFSHHCHIPQQIGDGLLLGSTALDAKEATDSTTKSSHSHCSDPAITPAYPALQPPVRTWFD